MSAQEGGTAGQAAYGAVSRVFGPEGYLDWADLHDSARTGWAAVERDIIAAQPQDGGAPARADEFARVKVRLSALVASLDETVERCRNTDSEFDLGAAHAAAVDARQLRQILDDTALGTTPQPAPELASLATVMGLDLDQAAEVHKALQAVNVTRAAVAPELRAAMAETRHLRADLRTLAELWEASADRDAGRALRPGTPRLVLEERAKARRTCASDIRKLAGPEGK